MASKAQSFVDVVLGEAVSGTPAQRYEDMKAIASAVVNRANALGVSPEDVIGAPGQFDAFGKSLPPGVESFRSLAEQAIAEVQALGPTHTGMFYATPSAVDNLPAGLQPVTETAGHVYFDDPKNRAIATTKGYVTPNKAAVSSPNVVDRLMSPLSAAADLAQGLYSRFSPFDDAMSIAPMPSYASAGLQFAHPNQSNIAPGLEDALMGVSAEFGQPLGITSGFRSPAYNAGVGGAKNSYHTKGLAADIDMTGMTPSQRQDLVTELSQRGVGGFITYSKSPNMMHVDMRPRNVAAAPNFMFDKTAAKMAAAPGWFQEMASFGGIKTPDVGPVPSSREVATAQAGQAAKEAAARQQMGQSMAQAGVQNLAGKPGSLGGLGGLTSFAPTQAPTADPYAGFETARAKAFSSMPAPPTASINPSPVASTPSLSAPAVSSISPTAISASALAPAAPTAAVTPRTVTPTTLRPTVAPPVKPAPVTVAPVPATRAVAARAPSTARTVRPAAAAYTAADVYSGRAPVGAKGAATGGNTVSMDRFGNRSVTNSYGVTTTTDPSGRQVGTFGSLGLGDFGKIGDKMRDAAPGLVGSAIGGALGGPLGAAVGGMVGSRAAGKTGGLGGLGGFLSGIFGGTSSSSRGGSRGSTSGRSSSGGRGGTSGRGGSSDRDHAGNQ